jgi:amino acid adenylation domain-containing protein/non-ribosomal peptide synthase protein (TIGR01720 family)
VRSAEHTVQDIGDREATLARLAELNQAARTETVTELLASMCAAVTDVAPGFDEPLFLQSLEAADLRSRIEFALGVSLALDELLDEDATLRDIATQVSAAVDESSEQPGSAVKRGFPVEPATADPVARHDPFPLTEIQQAYLLGRSGVFDLGDVSTHFYIEFDGADLDVARLGAALRALIERHDMLRAVVHPDGYQQILDTVPPYEIALTDLSAEPAESQQRRLTEIRDRMSHQVHEAGRWPLFEVAATRLEGRRTRLHVSLDLLIADGASIGILFREWRELYDDPDAPLLPLDLSFRDYVLAAARLKDGPRYAADREYWLSRITELPAAPELPLTAASDRNDRDDQSDHRDRFVRRQHAFAPETWARLRHRAASAGLTPSALLCAAYTDVLAAWSKDQRFTLNVTLGERLPLHPQVPALVGDFTSSVPLAVDASGTDAFDERAARLQHQLRQDLEHRLFGGVEIARELARSGGGSAARLPVVFTSLLGAAHEDTTHEDGSGPFGSQVFAVSQTPQVILDNQVLDRGGQLEVSWDAVEDRFQPGVLDAMFGAYCQLITRLTDGDEAIHRGDLLPAGHARRVAEANDTVWAQPTQLLHERVANQAAERPSAAAVIAGGRTLAYAELDVAANRLARLLRRHGAGPGQLVGVVMDKGWEQVVAVLGILRAGAAYLPIDASLPQARVHHLLERGEVRLALTQSAVATRLDWPAGIDCFVVDVDRPDDDGSPLDDVAGPDDLAYVIFTSGSTGEPKGVMITHRAAANTVADINDRFAIGPDDRILAVSSLSFDLSVWDIFGMLAAGGTVVIPSGDATRDPARWAELIHDHHVTVWNSVPALLGLVTDYTGGRTDVIGRSLRLALLSGDWIPVELPGRLRELVPDAMVISLGGATEGSIWSILHPIGDVAPGQVSIPYGRAMRNQRMYVLDADLEPRPALVPGEIFIGGAGVAAGYWRDEEKTAQRFVRHPRTGERLYRTGDLGRYLPDAGIEFIGREDSQVKIRGYRVELGEIEAVLAANPSVGAAVVTTAGPQGGPKRLVAHYVPVDGDMVDHTALTAHMARRLPDYMVPTTFVAHDTLPLTGNGKVDRGALAEPACPLQALSHNAVQTRGSGQPATDGQIPQTQIPQTQIPQTQITQTLSAIWSDVLGTGHPDPDDDFFMAGGDSLLALRFIAKAGAAGIWLRPQEFFEHPTFAGLVQQARATQAPGSEQGMVTGDDVQLTPNQLWFLDEDFAEANHWNGMWPLLSVGERLDPALLGAAVHRLLLHHDALRTRFIRTPDGWRARIGGADHALPVPFSVIDLSTVPDDELDREVGAICTRMQASLDLETGPVIRVTYLDLGPGRPGRLHIAAHWITLDYYSSRIFFEDLQTVYDQLRDGLEARPPAKSASVVDLGRAMRDKAQTPPPGEEAYWLDPVRHDAAAIPVDHDLGRGDQGSARRILASLTRDETKALTDLVRRERCEVREVLLLALGRTLAEWTGKDLQLIDVEGHGREDLVGDLDISRTISRYSTIWPLLMRVPADAGDDALADVVRQVRRPRDRGAWHGMLRFLSDDAKLRSELAGMPKPGIGFNYWGRVDEYFTDTIWPSTESPGPHRSHAGHRYRPLDVLGFLAGEELALVWSYSVDLHSEDTIRRLAERTMSHLRAIIRDESAPASINETDPAAAAVAIDEDRPLQLDGNWRLAGLGMQRSA